MSKRGSTASVNSNEHSGKRKRDPAFTSSEKTTLLNLVETHYEVVECKKTDTLSMKAKCAEWRQIAEEFNSVSSVYPRDWLVLKNCWENLKKRGKQELALRNQHCVGTGGGPPRKKIDDPFIERVLDLLQTKTLGYVNMYDSDCTQVLECTQDVIPHQDQVGTERGSPVTVEKEADEIKMEIMRVQLDREKEMLKQEKKRTQQEILKTSQEKIKLEILKLELSKLK